MKEQIESLFQWPNKKPNVNKDSHNWFGIGNFHVLTSVINDLKPKYILEMGSWTGAGSTKFIAEKAPDAVDLRRAAERLANRTKLDEAAEKQLSSFGWVDKAKGTVHLPISDAIALVVRDLSAKKPTASAVKVDAILPMPVVDPKSSEPAPSALPSSPQGADTVRFLPAAAPTVAVPPVAPTNPSPANPAPTK